MVFLSEASIREMVQEALGGGGYPTLDGDGKFPIIPSPLAEPIVTKMGLEPVRVMRVPTDKHEFELAVKELVDGVEDDHLPTLFLKLRELISDFVPPELEHSPCPHDDANAQDVNTMSNHNPPDDQIDKIRSEVRRLVKMIVAESDHDEDDGDDLKQFRRGGARFRPPHQQGLGNLPGSVEKDDDDPTAGDDWDSDSDGASYADDPAGIENDPGDNPYPADYLANPGYPDIGEDPELETWADLEKGAAGTLSGIADAASELDQFRGRVGDDDIENAAAAIDNAAAAPADTKRGPVGGLMDLKAIADQLGVGVGTVHGDIAIGARKLSYIGEYLGFQGYDEFYNQTTDKYIEFLIQNGAQKDDETGKPLLSMSDVMELRGASKFERDEDGDQQTRDLDEESANVRKAIQSTDTFREFLNLALEHEMKVDGYALKHSDAAKDKDKYSVIHRMKRTTR